jgi:hypothetical protein
MQIWHSRGYDSGVYTSAAATGMTREFLYPGDLRTLVLSPIVMAIHDLIDCEADVTNKIECNLILIIADKYNSIECFLDTMYSNLATNWTAKGIYGQ